MSFLDNHRGPFKLLLGRTSDDGKTSAEWAKGEIQKDDVEEEARALLLDPRDTIEFINVWSAREDCFVGGYR